MKTETMIPKSAKSSLLLELLQEQEGPCVSILLPILHPANMQKHNINLLRNGVQKAKNSLDVYRTTENIKEAISETLEVLAATVKWEGEAKSLGLFVSTSVSGVIEFPFEIDEMILVADSFETRDLWYLKEYLRPYYAVMMDKSGARLFKGVSDSLEEICNESFPVSFEDNHEYARSSPGTSFGFAMKGFEKDKGTMQDIRFKDQIRASAHHVASLLKKASDELVVAGPAKLAKNFVNAFPAPEKVLCSVGHPINQKDFQVASPVIWQTVQQSRRRKIDSIINELDNLGLNYKASGIRNVWKAAAKARGRVLLVERDFRIKAYLPDGAEEIRLRPPHGKYTVVVDAVDDVIEKVKSTGGEVVFVEHNQLGKFEGIALMFRY